MAFIGYGTLQEVGRSTPIKSQNHAWFAFFLAFMVLAVLVTIHRHAVVLDDDYHETDKVYPLESTENYPDGAWSGDTGAESSDQYPVESTEEDPIGEWSGDTGAEPSGQYPEESTLEIPAGEWSGDTGAEPSGQYPEDSTMEIPAGEWSGDTGSETSDQYPIIESEDS